MVIEDQDADRRQGGVGRTEELATHRQVELAAPKDMRFVAVRILLSH